MKHYVLLKFKPNYYNDDVLNYTKCVFNNIGKLENIENINVYKNCIDRDSNMDIMIEMEVKSKDMLSLYLQHKLHIDFVNTVDSQLISRVSFDCE